MVPLTYTPKEIRTCRSRTRSNEYCHHCRCQQKPRKQRRQLTPCLPDTNIEFRHLKPCEPPTPSLISEVLPQNGMQTPEIESKKVNPPIGSAGLPTSHKANCRSLIFENPVVARRLCSPIQTTLLFFAPVCPATSCAGLSCRTSHTLNFLSRDVVASIAPFALHDKLCTMSPCFRAKCALPLSMSQSLIV